MLRKSKNERAAIYILKFPSPTYPAGGEASARASWRGCCCWCCTNLLATCFVLPSWVVQFAFWQCVYAFYSLSLGLQGISGDSFLIEFLSVVCCSCCCCHCCFGCLCVFSAFLFMPRPHSTSPRQIIKMTDEKAKKKWKKREKNFHSIHFGAASGRTWNFFGRGFWLPCVVNCLFTLDNFHNKHSASATLIITLKTVAPFLILHETAGETKQH